ncbi:hypothetical protein MHYP_G00107750 [Metynnis hypsauchen]
MAWGRERKIQKKARQRTLAVKENNTGYLLVGTFCVDDGLQLYTLQALLRFPAGKSGLWSPRQQPKVPNHLSYPS